MMHPGPVRPTARAKDPKAIAGKVQMLYDCKGGTCGKCVIKIVDGEANISKLSGKKKRTLKLIVPELAESGRELDADKCHLACKATVTGPVVLELLGDTETGGGRGVSIARRGLGPTRIHG